MENIYFVYDPIENEFLSFTTEKAQQEEAKEIIECCMDDGEWMDEVDEVVAGVITSKATKSNIITRPKNIPLDEYGVDKEGYPWRKGEKYCCNYEMKPLDCIKERKI